MLKSYSFYPVNLEEEKKKFFFDPLYNPQFIFEEQIPHEELQRKYGPFGGELAPKAKNIIDSVISKWETESAYLNAIEGPILQREEATKIIQDYLTACGLEKKVTLKFSTKYIPRTHIDGFTMNIRLPIDYRERSIRGMLHHEIGTHVYRRINDINQVWFQHRDKYHMRDYLESEEGLAALHYYFDLDEPYLWVYALQYYACFLAKTMSFSEVYRELKPYVDDRDRRWKITLRAKRGVSDTSLPGGYTKDQVYLRGVAKISKWLVANDFDITKFYLGKVAIEDLDRLWGIDPTFKPLLPPFYLESPSRYQQVMKKVLVKNNFL